MASAHYSITGRREGGFVRYQAPPRTDASGSPSPDGPCFRQKRRAGILTAESGKVSLKIVRYFECLAAVKCIRAVLFVFRPEKNRDRVTLEACTGWIRHRGRFWESKTYTFVLDTRLSKGDVEVFLLDPQKQPLMKLNRQSSSRSILLNGNSRYVLRWEFRQASGTCELRW